MENRHAILLAGVQSRSGKTTVTLALMAALRRHGLVVAPFKAGPDFIDPSWHQAICGVPSHNLDTFMVGTAESRRLLDRYGKGGCAVVEGVMGLYDGKEGVGGPGSTADLARQLNLPVLLVVDGHGMAGSIAPLVAGYCHYAKNFSIAGVIANRVGRESHAQKLAAILQQENLPPLLGWLPRDENLALAERHLGLVLPGEAPPIATDHLASALHLDLEGFLRASQYTFSSPDSQPATPPLLQGVTIGIARDQAFCFLYPANLQWLQEMGATLRFFSPLAGDPFPADAQAAWLPGGYPELYGQALSQAPCWQGITRLAAANAPILAECGGMMALGTALSDLNGETWPMAGVLPITTHMTRRLAGLGYRQEVNGARGHEFHHSTRSPSSLPPAFQVTNGDGGVLWQRVRASYIHWYFPSAPTVCASWFTP
ncbi:MAG: cobyrinate a,c-diamide synthase [Magnetococcales bacterium]|nr:cobyrinate a,c-diamide synthase [Magnetococcales bacterium]NGZ28512.1 cobyrinate a,c-diamide synthase [Magnetococcales bacterium]